MKARPDDIIARARSAVGTRFRPQGRELDIGVDCVGLAMFAFRVQSDAEPRDYRLRGHHQRELERRMPRYFRRIRPSGRRPGDLILCTVSDDQMHLAIDCGGSFIHADARLRQVVETPGEPGWPVVGVFRRRTSPGRS